VLAVVQSLLSRGNVTDETYHAATAQFGERTLAELVWLVGYYSMLALALATFDPPNPDQVSHVF
jgi:4-carboxymuconolactone decarboxylase